MAVERCGGRCAAFSEIAPDAIDAYLSNHPEGAGTNLGDITKISALPPTDFLTAGVPCQSWSIAGRNLGFDDDRGQLWNDAIYLLNQSRPRAFLFENVKGLADPRNEHALRYIHDRIWEAGYHAAHYVLNSFDYGSPQSRVRIYIVGFREEEFFRSFSLPRPSANKVRLREIMDDFLLDGSDAPSPELPSTAFAPLSSLSANNNGHNDYFIFNDIRNGPTTVHSWDILPTSRRQKDICLLLLKNRRKRNYGPLDGNPLSLVQFQSLDSSISQKELDGLVELGILKMEKYSFAVLRSHAQASDLDDAEKLVLSKQERGAIVPDKLVCDRDIKKQRVKVFNTLGSLERKNLISCQETRYEFHHTKISTGLGGVCRIFLPTSNIFPTLVASDTNDYLTPVHVPATSQEEYKARFIEQVFLAKRFRKISKAEACRIQGFPDDFILPEARARWMKLLGNSVSVPVIQKLVQAIKDTGVFDRQPLEVQTARGRKRPSPLPRTTQPTLFDA